MERKTRILIVRLQKKWNEICCRTERFTNVRIGPAASNFESCSVPFQHPQYAHLSAYDASLEAHIPTASLNSPRVSPYILSARDVSFATLRITKLQLAKLVHRPRRRLVALIADNNDFPGVSFDQYSCTAAHILRNNQSVK